MKKVIKIILVSLTLLVFTPTNGSAQCPMCRISAETNMKYGGKTGRGLNAGILFLLSLPYVMVGSVAYIWWRNRIPENEE